MMMQKTLRTAQYDQYQNTKNTQHRRVRPAWHYKKYLAPTSTTSVQIQKKLNTVQDDQYEFFLKLGPSSTTSIKM